MSSLMPRQTMSCTVKAYHSNPEQLVYSEDPNSGHPKTVNIRKTEHFEGQNSNSPDIKGWVYQYKETNPLYSSC